MITEPDFGSKGSEPTMTRCTSDRRTIRRSPTVNKLPRGLSCFGDTSNVVAGYLGSSVLSGCVGRLRRPPRREPIRPLDREGNPLFPGR